MCGLRYLQCDSYIIPYCIVNKPNKHIYLAIKDGHVEVRAHTCVKINVIESLLKRKVDWVRAKLVAYESRHDLTKITSVYIWGESYQLEFANISMPFFENEVLTVNENQPIGVQLANFYAELMRKYIEMKLDFYAQSMNVTPTKVSIKHTTTQWGSCSSKNSLSFSSLAAQLPEDLVNYLIVHELAHINHKHHQAEFWAFVEAHYPNFKEARHLLRWYEKELPVIRLS